VPAIDWRAAEIVKIQKKPAHVSFHSCLMTGTGAYFLYLPNSLPINTNKGKQVASTNDLGASTKPSFAYAKKFFFSRPAYESRLSSLKKKNLPRCGRAL